MGRITNHNSVRGATRARHGQDRIAAAFIHTIGGRTPLHRRQVDRELGAAARGIGFVATAGA